MTTTALTYKVDINGLIYKDDNEAITELRAAKYKNKRDYKIAKHYDEHGKIAAYSLAIGFISDNHNIRLFTFITKSELVQLLRLENIIK